MYIENLRCIPFSCVLVKLNLNCYSISHRYSKNIYTIISQKEDNYENYYVTQFPCLHVECGSKSRKSQNKLLKVYVMMMPVTVVILTLITTSLHNVVIALIQPENQRRVPINICEENKLNECLTIGQNLPPVSPVGPTTLPHTDMWTTTTLSPRTELHKKLSSTLSTAQTPKQTEKLSIGATLDRTDTELNSVLVHKDNLIKQVMSTSETFCSFEEELHSIGSNHPIVCDPPDWQISGENFRSNGPSISLRPTEVDNSHKRQKRDVVMGQRAKLSPEELEKLKRLYGSRFELEAAERVKALGLSETNDWNPRYRANDYSERHSEFRPLQNPSHRQQMEFRSQEQQVDELSPNEKFYQRPNLARRRKIKRRRRGDSQEGHQDDPRPVYNVNTNDGSYSHENSENNDADLMDIDWSSKSKPELKSLLKKILEKLGESNEPIDNVEETNEELDAEEECSLYGTWLSPLAGVAIELRPFDSIISVQLKDLPNVKNKIIDQRWVGSVMISPVSPTTVTLLFQEGGQASNLMENSPETAVFVGQCVYCRGGTAIQGTWVVFSKKERDCFPVIATNGSSYGTNIPSMERLHRSSLV